MDKKYSVTVEDGEVVSMEVDGVQYTSVYDIPDPEDQEKVRELIEKTEEESFNQRFENFDKRFERDREEIEKKSAQDSLLFAGIFGAIALILLAIAGFSAVSTMNRLSKEQSAAGQVVEMVERVSINTQQTSAVDHKPITTTYYYPVVEFPLPGGTVKRVQLSEGSWPPAYEVGEQVAIRYNPDRPIEARIQSSSGDLIQWLVPLITGSIGIIFLAVAGIVFWVTKKSQAGKTEAEQQFKEV